MPEQTYADFDLLIERGDAGTYRARVLNSPAGETRPVTVTMPFSALELENFLLKIGRPRREATRGESSPEAAAIRDFGGRLFDAVFRDQLRTALARSLALVEGQEDTGLRLRLRLADTPELADLPWEYLYDRDARRFLALSQWTPVVRYLELSSPVRPLSVTPPLRILMMAASPTDFPELDGAAEWTKVRDALADLEEAGRVQLDRVPSGTLADLRAVLRGGEYHVFHFIGHGRYDPETQDGVLALEGPRGRAQLVSGSDLGALLHDERSLRLAVLNSCEGARGGISDPYSGTAQSLVYQGIPAVVAMQFEITDSAAIAFAHSLYATVADGYPLDAALAEARNAVREQPNPVEWATPVLYLRAPDGRVFDIPAMAPAPPAPPGPREPPPPPTPGQPPTEPGKPSFPHRRAVLVAGAIVVALSAATVGAVLFNSRESPSGGGSSSAASVFPSPYPPAPDLPQGSRLPDSMLVVPLSVAGNTDLYVLDTGPGDNAWSLVTTHGKDLAPVISPDRTSIVYAHEVDDAGGRELRVVATDGLGDRPLFAGPVEGCASPGRPAWNLVDPRELAVACHPYQGAYVAELRVMTLTGETIRTLPAGVSLLDDVTFSPDGTAIVYWGRNDPADDGGQLYSVPADGSGPARQLTDVAGNADADFSPSGDEIAFRRVTPDGAQIYVMAADGSGEHAVTDAGWVDQDPTWSPDGNWIGFKSNRAGVLPGEQFWIIDRNGEGLRQLGHDVVGVADNAPAWGHR